MIFTIEDIRLSLDIFRESRDYLPENGSLVQAAVLVPLISQSNDLSLIFTRRSNDLARHAGQVSFPGGVRDHGDQTPLQTALRESCEEIGLSDEGLEVIAQLQPYNSSTGYCVYPVVAVVKDAHGLKRNFEVEKLFCVPLSWLEDPSHSYQSDYVGPGQKINKLWFFTSYDGEIIWGLTAQITKDFIALIKKER